MTSWLRAARPRRALLLAGLSFVLTGGALGAACTLRRSRRRHVPESARGVRQSPSASHPGRSSMIAVADAPEQTAVPDLQVAYPEEQLAARMGIEVTEWAPARMVATRPRPPFSGSVR